MCTCKENSTSRGGLSRQATLTPCMYTSIERENKKSQRDLAGIEPRLFKFYHQLLLPLSYTVYTQTLAIFIMELTIQHTIYRVDLKLESH